jgi:head-tail adaptor
MIQHLLNRTLEVWRPETTPDGSGGQTVTYDQLASIRVQVNQPTVEERLLAQQAGSNLSHVIHARYGVDAARGDELGGNLPSDVPSGARLRVISAVSNSRQTYTRIEAEVTQTEGH